MVAKDRFYGTLLVKIFFTFLCNLGTIFVVKQKKFCDSIMNHPQGPGLCWRWVKINSSGLGGDSITDKRMDGWILLTPGVPVFLPESRIRSRLRGSVFGPCKVMHYLEQSII